MSNECEAASPFFTLRWPRLRASSMVRPITNWWPMMRMACRIAVRTTGSPWIGTVGASTGRVIALVTPRKGDSTLGNYNFAIIGAPGSGKSVLMNEMAWSYRAIDAKVWMLDLGRSFEKLCRVCDGQLIEFRASTAINVNPFSAVTDIPGRNISLSSRRIFTSNLIASCDCPPPENPLLDELAISVTVPLNLRSR